MDVQRFPYQGSKTLREFYADCVARGGRSAEIGRRMLTLLDGLASTDGPALQGLTSHLALGLFPTTAELGCGVSIHEDGPGYVIVPAFADSVWQRGHAADVASAVELVLAGLVVSCGPVSAAHDEPHS